MEQVQQFYFCFALHSARHYLQLDIWEMAGRWSWWLAVKKLPLIHETTIHAFVNSYLFQKVRKFSHHSCDDVISMKNPKWSLFSLYRFLTPSLISLLLTHPYPSDEHVLFHFRQLLTFHPTGLSLSMPTVRISVDHDLIQIIQMLSCRILKLLNI